MTSPTASDVPSSSARFTTAGSSASPKRSTALAR